MTLFAADLRVEALAIFAVVVAITLVVTYLASKRMSSATDFWAAGRGITGVQNGFAIAGDYMSAASFLGIAGLIYLFGFDGFLYSVGFLVAFLTVLFLLSERMRNVRSETGLGAEVGTGRGLTGRTSEPEPEPATTTR